MVAGMSAVKNTLWMLLFWFCCAPALAAAPTPALSVYNNDDYALADFLDFLEDPDHRFTVNDILTPAINEKFHRLENTSLTFGLNNSDLWFRLRLKYPSGAPNTETIKSWYLEIARTMLDVAEIHILRPDGSLQRFSADIRRPFSERPVKHVNSILPVDMALGDELTLYIHVRNSTSTFLPMTLWSPAGFAEKVAHEEFLYGVFYGGMCIICIYNLLLFLSGRSARYLTYVGYLFAVIIFEFIDIGHGVALFPYNEILFKKQLIPFYFWMVWIFGFLFVQNFLDIKTRHPAINYFFNAVYGIAISSLFISPSYDVFASVVFLAHFGGSMIIVVLVISAYVWYKGHEDAGFFTYAWSFNIGGFFLYSLIVLGLTPAYPILLAAMPIGTLLESTVLALALANRIKKAEKRTLFANEMAIENLARFRSVFDNAVEGLYQMTLGGRLLNVNPSLAKMLGYTSVEALLNDPVPAANKIYPAPEQQFLALADQRHLLEERNISTSSGQTIFANHSAQLICDENGAPMHIEGSLVDVGESKERERAQRERLRERREKQLARSATESKSQFLKTMSYEIRTPLTAIIGFSESLRSNDLDPAEKQVAVDMVTRNSVHLLQLINDILDFSKIEAGKMAIESIAVDVLGLVNQTCAHFEPIAQKKGLHFRLSLQFPLPAKVLSDPTRLKQILHNLCNNAIKFTQIGQITLEIRWDGAQQQLFLSVRDTGAGINKEKIRLLTQLVHQPRTQQLQAGIGLGITITHQLTQLMGGQLTFDSEENVGSQFTACIACKLPENSEWMKESASLAPPRPKALQGIPLLTGHVLLAEDNPVNQKLIQRVISKTGAQVTVAGDGQQALEAACQQRFDLILMDINMPVMGGLEATRALRATGYSQPIFALTAEHGQAEVDASLTAGCNGHLTKPLELVPFYQVLAAHLPARHTTSEANTQGQAHS